MSLILRNSNDVTVSKTRIIKFENGQLVERSPTLLLDVSGSMVQTVGGRRKIDILRDAVEKVGSGMQKYAFSSHMNKVSSYIPEPEGSTNLERAFQELKGSQMSLLLISDGVADSPDEAIRAGIALKTPVNVLYIGSSGDQGEDFMCKLAETTGGKWLTLDTMQDASGFQMKLEDGIEKMLLMAGA